MYVRHLKIEDLRAIRTAEIDLLYPGGSRMKPIRM